MGTRRFKEHFLKSITYFWRNITPKYFFVFLILIGMMTDRLTVKVNYILDAQNKNKPHLILIYFENNAGVGGLCSTI